MREAKGRAVTMSALSAVVAALIFSVAACGGEARKSGTETTTKLPPGMTEEEAGASSAYATANGLIAGGEADAAGTGPEAVSSSAGEAATCTVAATSGESASSNAKTVTLSGVTFTVVAAKRQDSNKLVSSSGQREVSGDFLEVELVIKNTGDDLVDLSRFSFRLWNPYITASSYDDYYGSATTYGGYVSGNIISAALLDYASLQQVAYTLRIGEEVGDVFLFYDLNPLSVSANEGFTKEGANLIFYDTESGEKVEVNLAGYTD